MLRITEVVKHLLIINVLLFVADMVFSLDILSLYYPGSKNFQPFQIATHFFMHGSFMHIAFNMFALWMFGSALETLWGPKRFLFFYFACALGAAALHTGFTYLDFSAVYESMEAFNNNPNYNTFWAFFNDTHLPKVDEFKKLLRTLSDGVRAGDGEAITQSYQLMMQYYEELKNNTRMLGASGAVFGLLLAFGMKFPNTELMLIFFPVPIKAKYFIPVLMVIELFLGVNQFSWDNIAHFAHLGGAITGFFLILYWQKFGSRFE